MSDSKSNPAQPPLNAPTPPISGEVVLTASAQEGSNPVLPEPEPVPTLNQPPESIPIPETSSPPANPTPPPPPSASTTPPPAAPKAPSPVPPPQIKKSPFRFLIPLLIFGAFILLIFFAYNRFIANRSTDTANPEPITLTYWGLWEPSSVMDSVISAFESQNPHINIEYQQQSHRDYRERLQNALAQKQGPDLFRFHHTWVPMLGPYLSRLPSDVYSQNEYQATFYPIASESLNYQGNLVGIPLMIDGLGLYYNQNILTAAGLTPPTTWEELRTTAKRVAVATDTQLLRGGVALGTTSNVEHWPDIVGLMLLQNGADPAHPNTPLGEDALTFYTLFSRVDRVWDDTLPSSTFAFATERAVMMLAPSWRAHEVAEINPNLEFAIVPAPKLPDADTTWASFWAEGVSLSSSRAHQQAAWSFLKFLSSKDTMRQFYAAASDHPGRLFGEPFSRVDMADQLSTDPLVGAYITQAPFAKSWFLASYTHDNGLNDQLIKYYEDAINAINQGETPTNALKPVESGVSQVFSQFGLSR